MPYVIIDKTIREVVATTSEKPTITDPNQIGLELKSLANITIRHQVEAPQTPGSYGMAYVWIAGTAYTQEQIDAEVLRQSTYGAQIQAAIAAIVASVNGKPAATLAAADAIKLVQLLCAQQGWIDPAGKIAVPADLQTFIR